MKTIVLANQKGGVGKTALVVHFAFFLEERGKKVVVVDMDTQANSSFSLSEYKSGLSTSDLINGSKEPGNCFDGGRDLSLVYSDPELANMSKLSLADVSKKIRVGFNKLADIGFDVCIVDTPPSLGTNMVAPLYSADYILSPVQADVFAIQGLNAMITTIKNTRKVNKKLKFLGLVPNMVDKRVPIQMQLLNDIKARYKDFVTPIMLTDRSNIKLAVALKTPVWKIKKSAARPAGKELKELFFYICKKMNMEIDNV